MHRVQFTQCYDAKEQQWQSLGPEGNGKGDGQLGMGSKRGVAKVTNALIIALRSAADPTLPPPLPCYGPADSKRPRYCKLYRDPTDGADDEGGASPRRSVSFEAGPAVPDVNAEAVRGKAYIVCTRMCQCQCPCASTCGSACANTRVSAFPGDRVGCGEAGAARGRRLQHRNDQRDASQKVPSENQENALERWDAVEEQ